MTRAEIVLWYSLKGKQLLGYKFRRQHGVDRYILDFYCPELMLAIEVDGESHNSDEARERDRKRQEEIEQYGIRFLRFTDDEVLGTPDRVVGAIEEKVREVASSRDVPMS
jgi:very-short-patch-repair endonuclease